MYRSPSSKRDDLASDPPLASHGGDEGGVVSQSLLYRQDIHVRVLEAYGLVERQWPAVETLESHTQKIAVNFNYESNFVFFHRDGLVIVELTSQKFP